MEQIKKQFGLEGYNILGYCLKSKQKQPVVCIICKKGREHYMMKAAFKPDNNLVNNQIKAEYEILKQRYNSILQPKLVNGNLLRTRYLFAPSLSYYMNSLFGGSKHVDLAIKWLAKFHDENHKEGFGQVHGDFSPHDIIISGRNVIVLDWEDYEENNDQLIDIYYFIYRSTFSYVSLGNKEQNKSKFVSMIIGKENLHPFLKKYMKFRGMNFSAERRKKAFKAFIEQRLKREDKFYSIPKKDRYVYRKMKELIN